MLTVKVLGPGCMNCDKLEQHAVQAAEDFQAHHSGVEIAVQKLTDVRRFVDYGLLTTPGLVINERLVTSGRIPPPAQILGWMEEAHLQGSAE